MADDPERPGAQEWVPPGAGVDELRRAAPDCRGCELWQDAARSVLGARAHGAHRRGSRQSAPAGCRASNSASSHGRHAMMCATEGFSWMRRLPRDDHRGRDLMRIEDPADRASAFAALVEDLRTAADAAV